MKKPVIATLAGLAFCLNLNATTGHEDGRGTAKRAPESAQIEFRVISKCYSTSDFAGKANDSTVPEFVENLEAFLASNNPADKIETKFISNGEFSDSIYIDGKTQPICQGTFQQTTKVTFMTNNMALFSQNLAAIRKMIRGMDTRVQGKLESPATYIEIANISTEICDATEEAMDVECTNAACSDLKKKIRNVIRGMGGKGAIKVTQISTADEYSGPRVNYSHASFAEDSTETIVPFTVADVTRTARVSCEYSCEDISFSVDSDNEDSSEADFFDN